MSLTSLGGVALGGALSFVVQHATQRSAERMEQQRQQAALSESRRDDRLALLERFVEVAAEAERCAFSRPSHWQDGDVWHVQTQAVMNRLWVAERMIRLLFPLPVHDATRAYFLDSTGSCGKGYPTVRACATTWKTPGWHSSTPPEPPSAN